MFKADAEPVSECPEPCEARTAEAGLNVLQFERAEPGDCCQIGAAETRGEAGPLDPFAQDGGGNRLINDGKRGDRPHRSMICRTEPGAAEHGSAPQGGRPRDTEPWSVQWSLAHNWPSDDERVPFEHFS